MRKCEKGFEQKFQTDLQQKFFQKTNKKPFKLNREEVIHKQQLKIADLYEIKNKIGQGSFGQVYKLQHKTLKVIRALKTIKKQQNQQNSSPVSQLQILKQLDHPNVLKIYQYFQNERQLEIVTQYFEGKELFYEIVTEKKLSQKKAAIILAELCKALAYIHSHKIVHRDIKPQNIMVKQIKENQYKVKLIDWGLGSKYITQLIRKCGTPEYCAPEVIKGLYGCECDIWSLGVVLYVMLSGKFPFKGVNARQTLNLVLKGQLNFDRSELKNVSIDAKILISKMLQKDPKKRIKACECLNQPWIINNISEYSVQNQQKLTQTLERLKEVSYENKFQAVVINLIHNYIQSTEQQQQLKKQFQFLDENKDGVLSVQQVQKAYEKLYPPIEAKIITEQLFSQIDLDNSNSIQYSQFIAFGRQITTEFSNQQLKQIFRQFDEDKDGRITKKQLSKFLSYQRLAQSRQFDNLIREIDTNQDGVIDFQQFMENVNKAIRKAINQQKYKQDKKQTNDQFCQKIALNILDTMKPKFSEYSTSKTFSQLTDKEDKQINQ